MEISIHHIRHTYADNPVLDDVCFSLKAKRIYGLVGENGAGKTTLISLLAGLQELQSGRITNVFRPGLLLQGVGFYQNLTASENLNLFVGENGIAQDRVDMVFQLTNFTQEFRQKKYRLLSAGYKQRLAIARSFLTDGNLILLDEPFTAVDLPTIRILKKAIKGFVTETGKTVLISSHQLKEVRDLLDDTLFINDGKVTFFAEAQKTEDDERRVYVSLNSPENITDILSGNKVFQIRRKLDDVVEVAISEGAEIDELLQWFRAVDVQWYKIEKQPPLEFLFL